jgi:hypothetical protein
MELARQTMGLQIGGVCCALRCKDEDVYSRLKRLYANFFTEQAADITVELEGKDGLEPAAIGTALEGTKYIHRDNCFVTTSDLITGQYDLAQHSIRITGEKSLVDPDLEINHLNKLLSLAYYSACKVKYNGNPPAMLVHTCAIIRGGQALLFAGPSEAGKTTIARLCGEQDGEVLNDEIVLVSRPSGDDRRVTVQGAPFVSRFSPRQNKSAPLSCVLMLKKGLTTSVRRLDNVDAYLRFIRQILSPAYIGQKDRRTIYSLMADFSSEITQSIPFYELEFSLNADHLWNAIEELEG